MRYRSLIAAFQVLCLLIPCVTMGISRTPAEMVTNRSLSKPAHQANAGTVSNRPSAFDFLGFEENRGQVDMLAQYIVRAGGSVAFLTGSSIVFSLAVPDEKSEKSRPKQARQPADYELPETHYLPVRLDFVGANRSITLSGEEPLSGTFNYFIGSDRNHWATGVRRFTRVQGRELYPGIDIAYYFSEQEMEYDVIVHPGADPSSIQLNFDWADQVSVTKTGDIKVQKGKCHMLQRAPVVYQIDDNGARIETRARYLSEGDGRVHIDLGEYDKDRELVIDPRVAMATYLGGSVAEFGRGIAIGSDGSIFVTGYTDSVNFPTQNAFQPVKLNTDAFVTKLTADGTSLVYSTFFGGNGYEAAAGLALDSNDAAYITGTTSSANLPTTSGAPQTSLTGVTAAFVTKLDPSGASLAYSTYLGGATVDPWTLAPGPGDFATDISLFTDGSAVVVGYTYCSDFPTTSGAFQTDQRGIDAFVTKINPTGTSLDYSTYLGGGGVIGRDNLDDWAYGVAAYSDGSVFITGQTGSPQFPTTPGAFKTSLQSFEAFVTRLNASGTGLIYSTLLGGDDFDYARTIAVDSYGVAYVAGQEASSDFPTTPDAFQPTGPGQGYWAGFVTKVAPDGASLLYSTHLTGSTGIFDIGVNSNGDFAVTGYTTAVDFPLLLSCYPRAGWSDGFVTKFEADGSLAYSMLLGGNGNDFPYALAFDQAGRVCVLGETDSTDIPVSPGAFQPALSSTSYPYYSDLFIAVIGSDSCTCSLEFAAANYTVAENVPGGKVTIEVKRNGSCSDPISVDYATLANTATAGSDYTTRTGTLFFGSGEMLKTFDVPIINDSNDETTESFFVQLSNPGAGHLLGQMRTAVVTIEDDDLAGAFEFDSAFYTCNEGVGTLTITVNRVGGSSGSVSVKYAASAATASGGSDFTTIPATTLTFANGQTTKTFTVTILNDALEEGAEEFNLTLSAPSGRSTLGKQSKAVVYILDDEVQ